MSLYRIEPPEPPPQRSPWLITFILALLVLLLALTLWIFNLSGLGMRVLATPTPSRTPATPATATPDFRSTLNAEDQLTQIAFLATVTQQTLEPSYAPLVVGGAVAETAISSSINLPLVGGSSNVSPLPIPSEEANQPPTPMPVTLPDVGGPAPQPESPLSPLGTPTPVGQPVPVVIDEATPTPTETPFVPPTETETPTWTPSPTVFFISGGLAARVTVAAGTPVYLRPAPMTTFTPVATLVPGSNVRIVGRGEAGEWVYVCCAVDGQQRWVRLAYVAPVDNTLPDNAPPSATPNDPRWVPTQAWPADQPQPPAATEIPVDDYPMVRHDRANTGRVPTAFNGAIQLFSNAVAAARITTPPVVSDQLVIAASADHSIYGFNRAAGNQAWKYTTSGVVSMPLLVQDHTLYYVDDEGGRAKAGAIQLGSNTPQWLVDLNAASYAGSAAAATGFIAADDSLYIGVKANDKYYIVRMDRGGGGTLAAFDLGALPPVGLAVGHQLLYVAGSQLWALDLDTLEVVWTRADLGNPAVAPLYAANGVSALAELYLAFNDGRTHALDANTGALLHSYGSNGQPVKGLALGDGALYVTTTGMIRAFERRSSGLYWEKPTAGDTLNGAIVTPDQIILVSTNGVIEFRQPGTGETSGRYAVNGTVSFAPAVSGSYIFVPVDNGSGVGQVYGYAQ